MTKLINKKYIYMLAGLLVVDQDSLVKEQSE